MYIFKAHGYPWSSPAGVFTYFASLDLFSGHKFVHTVWWHNIIATILYLHSVYTRLVITLRINERMNKNNCGAVSIIRPTIINIGYFSSVSKVIQVVVVCHGYSANRSSQQKMQCLCRLTFCHLDVNKYYCKSLPVYRTQSIMWTVVPELKMYPSQIEKKKHRSGTIHKKITFSFVCFTSLRFLRNQHEFFCVVLFFWNPDIALSLHTWRCWQCVLKT